MSGSRFGPDLVIAYDLADELARLHPYDPLTGRCARCRLWVWPCPTADFAAFTKHDARPHP